MAKPDHKGRALAPSSGLGRTALVFDDNDVVDLLRTHCCENRIVTVRRALGDAIVLLPEEIQGPLNGRI
jgi:hypothetical protein